MSLVLVLQDLLNTSIFQHFPIPYGFISFIYMSLLPFWLKNTIFCLTWQPSDDFDCSSQDVSKPSHYILTQRAQSEKASCVWMSHSLHTGNIMVLDGGLHAVRLGGLCLAPGHLAEEVCRGQGRKSTKIHPRASLTKPGILPQCA